jgi:AbrB family looped-hinge helix DNA binding protein
MSSIQSKVTAQGQISVPAEVRRQLGVGPGSVLVWEWRDGAFIVRRDGKCTSADIHAALFGATTRGRSKPTDIKAGVRSYIRRKHARG